MRLNLHNTIPKGTAQFAIPSKAEIRSDAKVSCPFCHKENVALSGSGTLEQHLYHGYHMCEAGGKSIEDAKRLRLDEHFNVVHDKDVVDDDDAVSDDDI